MGFAEDIPWDVCKKRRCIKIGKGEINDNVQEDNKDIYAVWAYCFV